MTINFLRNLILSRLYSRKNIEIRELALERRSWTLSSRTSSWFIAERISKVFVNKISTFFYDVAFVFFDFLICFFV